MIARLCVKWVYSFLLFALVVVPLLSVSTDALSAAHTAIGYHPQRYYAENSAKNKGRAVCSDQQLQFSQEGATVFGVAPDLFCNATYSTCKSARVNYNCVTPPPQSTTRPLFNISGNWHCEDPSFNPPDKVALQSFENAASSACQNIDPRVNWFLEHDIPRNKDTRPTGSCGGVDDGWYVPRQARWSGDAVCKLLY